MLFLWTVLALATITNGMRPSYKRHILEFQNTIRAEVARGEIELPKRNISVPQAAGMRVFEWWMPLEDEAKKLAKKQCNGDEAVVFKPEDVNVMVAIQRSVWAPKNANIAEILGNLTDLSDPTTRDEQPWVDARFNRLGCAMRNCTDRQLMVCVYAADSLTPLGTGQLPYKIGPPCSDCPTGNDYCINNVLCATRRQCFNTWSRIDCLVEPKTCEDQGGSFDSVSCDCMCNEKKSTGIYCDRPCKNDNCTVELTEAQKVAALSNEKSDSTPSPLPTECVSLEPAMRLLMTAQCRLFCNLCRVDPLDSIMLKPPVIPINIYARDSYLDREWVYRRRHEMVDFW